jgi:hypothetical protein
MKSELNEGATRATLEVTGEFSANALEDLITKLAVLRSTMSPPVTERPPDATTDPEKRILMESDCAMTAALRRNGGIRLWFRNSGIGWVAYEVEPERARAIAQYILSRTPEEGIDLFASGDGYRH